MRSIQGQRGRAAALRKFPDFYEDSLVNHRLSALFVAACTCLLLVGCQPESESTSQDPQVVAGRAKFPVIEGATLDGLKTKLGASYSVRQEGPPTILAHEQDGHEVVIMVNHDPAGNVNSIVCHVVGPADGDDTMDRLCAETTKTLTEVLGVAADQEFLDRVAMGVARMRIGCSSTFSNGLLYFTLSPKQTLSENPKWVAFKPDHVYRDILVMPRKSGASSDSNFQPIEGASFEQLMQVLEGFEVVAKFKDEEVLLTRAQDDHSQYVYCQLKDGTGIRLIEAFAGSFADGVDTMKLHTELWKQVAQLQYRECNPEEVVTFLEGPQPTYAVDFSRSVGYAKYYLPYSGTTGKRDRLMVWATEPPRKL